VPLSTGVPTWGGKMVQTMDAELEEYDRKIAQEIRHAARVVCTVPAAVV
jgi:hypothetical protein